jgi:hypothetical protein
MFCSEEAFNDVSRRNYRALNIGAGVLFFDGGSNFSCKDFSNLSSGASSASHSGEGVGESADGGDGD